MLAGIQVNAQDVELCGGVADDVPRELVNPSTSEVLRTQRIYWSPDAPKGLKKGETLQLIDKRGNPFTMDAAGFVVQTQTKEQEQGA